MSKKIGGILVLVGICALSLFLLNCGSSSSRPSGLLYVLTQSSNGTGNVVSSFAINLGSGGLSLINSNASTCATNGVSCGLPLDIVLDPAAANAFVLNQGVPASAIAPTIYSYSIASDGGLAAQKSPVAATLPVGDLSVAMTRDAAGKFMFVIDQGSTATPQNCPAPHDPNPSDPKYTGCPSITVYSISSGSLTRAQTYFLGRVPTAITTLSFTPSGGSAEEYVFLTSNNDPVLHNDNTVAVYRVDSSGLLTELNNSPYATSTDPLSVAAVNTNPAGQTTGGIFVYAGTQPTAAAALNIFQMCTVIGQGQGVSCSAQDVAARNLLPVTTPPPPAPGAYPVAMLVDSTNQFLYIACQLNGAVSGAVYAYKIATTTGTLTSLSPANQPTGAGPVALAMHPSTNTNSAFLYTSNSLASNISGFSVSTTTGSLSSPITVNSPPIPTGMAAR